MPMSLGRWIHMVAIFILVVIAFFFIRTHVAGGQTFVQDVAGEVALGLSLIHI